jgi:hypothetical protein
VQVANWIALAERANVLAPLPSAPGWLADRSRDGFVGITVAWLAPLLPLGEEFRLLSISSANLTRRRSA